LTSKIDSAAATSAKRKSQVKDLQARLASLIKEQAEMDRIRAEKTLTTLWLRMIWNKP